MASSQVIDGVCIASLEHLLVLKLDAYASRRGSAKGAKDERDLIKILHLLDQSTLRAGRLESYLTDEAIAMLGLVKK